MRCVAVIVEQKRHKALHFVISKFKSKLKACSILLVHSAANKEFISNISGIQTYQKELKSNIPLFDGRHPYNKFLLNKNFFNRLNAEQILIFQTDTIICKTITHLPDVDFIGGISNVLTIPENKDTLFPKCNKNERRPLCTFHLNGGLQLRNMKWFNNCNIKQTMEDKNLNECRRTNSRNITYRDVLAFSSDGGTTGCFEDGMERICPTFVHKPWRKNNMDLIKYCPDILTLYSLNGKSIK